MTDITELAQKPTRYGTNSQGVFTNQTDGAYVSYLDFMALVEALEKAQAKIIELQRKYEIDPRTHEIIDLEERVAELESEVEKWKQEAESWEQVAEKQLATAIELESRTVKLPPRGDSSNVPFAGNAWNCCMDEVEKRLAAAGIKVEAE